MSYVWQLANVQEKISKLVNLFHVNQPNVCSQGNGLHISLMMSLSEPTASLRQSSQVHRIEE